MVNKSKYDLKYLYKMEYRIQKFMNFNLKYEKNRRV